MDLIAGVDEAGRGPLAGAVIAGAVILDPKRPIEGLNDSKKLSEKKRNSLEVLIKQRAIAWAIGRAEVAEIDHLNILQASLLAMQRAVLALDPTPNAVEVDGNKCPDLIMPVSAIIGGDGLVPSIGAASILAKVARDREIIALDAVYPGYGLAQHKGYPTKAHLEAIHLLGVTPIHRTSFRPVKRVIELQKNIDRTQLTQKQQKPDFAT